MLVPHAKQGRHWPAREAHSTCADTAMTKGAAGRAAKPSTDSGRSARTAKQAWPNLHELEYQTRHEARAARSEREMTQAPAAQRLR
jgi:hypothetical protein